MDSYSLIEQNWIPAVDLAGERVDISLREALLHGAAYRRIDAGHPLGTAALYRLLLATLHRALSGPRDAEEGADWYLNGFPTEQVSTYLEKYAGRFHLFGPQPFLQIAGLDPAQIGENFRSHWTRLSAEEGSSNTTALFNVEARPGGSRSDSLSPAEAALRLLTHQTFALGGLIKRLTTAAKAAPVATAALFLAEGSHLQQTLALNLVPYPESMQGDDLPPWEAPPLDVAAIRGLYEREESWVAKGLVSRSTWLSRSILLLPEETEAGVVVRSIGFAAGVPLDGPGEGSGGNTDPMLSLRPSRDPKNDQPFPYKLRRDRLLWRDLNALLPDASAEAGVGKKGQTVQRPGLAPRTVNHARDVMRRAAQRQKPTPPQIQPLDSWDDWGEGEADALAAHPVLPVLAFGQLTDQGKAFAMRQESYTLPEQFIQTPELFRDHVQEALNHAQIVGDGLRTAVRTLAYQLMKKGGEREPHKDDVSRLAAQIPAEGTYWAGLDTAFRRYLLELDTGPQEALGHWHAALVTQARRGWRVAEQAAGMNAAGLRAVQKASGPLLRILGSYAPREVGTA